jgi:hypothetical protein
MLDILAQVRGPSDLPLSTNVFDRSAGLRDDAQYLHDLYAALEPIVERVAQKAVDETDCKDVTAFAPVLLEALDDYVLSVMRGRAEDMEEEVQDDLWASRR